MVLPLALTCCVAAQPAPVADTGWSALDGRLPALDTARYLVFVPTGCASPDCFVGDRSGDNRWANSVVALDGDTGKLKWGQQLVAAVLQARKTGVLFAFERDSGAPIVPILDRPVPQDAVPGEHPSPTRLTARAVIVSWPMRCLIEVGRSSKCRIPS